MSDNNQPVSFLHESQLEGKAQGGKIALENWEEAMKDLTKIIKPEAQAALKEADYENWPKTQMATYCQDCRKIVAPELKNFRRGRGKKSFERLVCGVCGSKKIASGREEALKQFYHLKEENEESPAPETKNKKKS